MERGRYRGCLLGLAAGDAVGTTVEFCSPGSFAPLADMVGGGHFRLQPGQWTDDTSMALCLAESLIVRQGFDPVDQLERYRRWWREGHLSSNGRCFDIGDTTRQALARFERTREAYCGSTDPKTAGNGSLMRLAPAPMFYAADPAMAVERSGESSRTTHGAAVCVDACRYMGALIVAALRGAGKDALLSGEFVPELSTPEIKTAAAGSFRRKEPPAIKGTGYVVDCLEAALWAFDRSRDFREGCLLAANLGDDADTTAAVYGQLAGAYYGEEGIPAEWRARLAMREVMEGMADGLWERAEQIVLESAAERRGYTT